MVIDTSALVAILTDEPERLALSHCIDQDPRRLVSAATVLEATLVIEGRYGESGGRELDLLLHRINADVVALTVEQLNHARHGWRTFGKGRHRAALNFGDCFSYGLSRHSGEPLLFKGHDFSQTDVAVVGY